MDPDLVWVLWGRQNFVPRPEISLRFLGRAACARITIPTTLYQLHGV
jgi:hypothetical protein